MAIAYKEAVKNRKAAEDAILKLNKEKEAFLASYKKKVAPLNDALVKADLELKEAILADPERVKLYQR